MAPGDLQEVLSVLKPADAAAHQALLVGLGRADDAAVYRVSADFAIVETVDFFPPVVDDAYAVAVAGFPRDFPKSIIAEVFRGAAEKVAEAGGVIAGGHTVVDAEPKYGLCVTGRVHPDRVLMKGGLRSGDRLFLSKPLGTGVITTAAKNDAASADVLDGAIRSMLRLNRVAAEVASACGAKGATDITGFGLLGHAAEMIEASTAGIAVSASRVPLLAGALELAEKGHWSGGMKRNRRHVDATFGSRLQVHPDVPAPVAGLISESETSGGLLFSIDASRAGEVVAAFRARGEECAEIGEVVAEPIIRIQP
jgi:selenide,water dikinase